MGGSDGDLCHSFYYTEQGLDSIKGTVKRTEAARAAAEKAGLKINDVLWLQGQYDFMAIVESNDEVATAAFALNTLELGNVRGETLRAFTAAEMEKILEKVQ
jgi:uncharacterized protein with GYD domain